MLRHVVMFACESRGRTIHPGEKMLVVFLPIILLGFSRSGALLAANIGLFLSLHLFFRTPWRWVLRSTLTLLGFVGSSSPVLLLEYPLDFVLLVVLRATFSAFALTFFLFTTPPGDIFLFLSRFQALREFCTIAQGMEHFILVLEEECHRLVVTIGLRGGFRTWRLAVRNSGKIGALLFKNALTHYERTKEALDSRLFPGFIPSWERPYTFSGRRLAVILAYIAGLSCAVAFLP
jgi:cobalt/nickel transport system permease protein